jgi:hypothetical protein
MNITELRIVRDDDIFRIIGAVLNLTNKELEIMKHLSSIANKDSNMFEVRDIDLGIIQCTDGTMRNYLTKLRKKLAIVPTGFVGMYKLNVLISVTEFKLSFNWEKNGRREKSVINEGQVNQ